MRSVDRNEGYLDLKEHDFEHVFYNFSQLTEICLT